MKKLAFLTLGVILFSSCLNDDTPNFTYGFVAIDEATTPTSFTYGEKDTIYLKYTLPNSCYHFNDVYYEYEDTTRIVAVRAFIDLDVECIEEEIEKEYELIVNVTQEEDYLFKFYKGKDIDGENIFEEVVIPVN
ncbi:hypothetical protein [uncultured Polaribacter sp.]|uniref:hypothetical protein n=1 Tax=uncultured Polaribacter sp. TaxID=174711 RepID=UPI00260D4806|nr:hypothetical protein [uncultured Polaribacter sp.]